MLLNVSITNKRYIIGFNQAMQEEILWRKFQEL